MHNKETHDHSCGGHDHHHHSSPLDDLTVDQGLTIEFQGVFKARIEDVWDMLTNNEKINLWFPELEFVSLKSGGVLRFNHLDGESEEMLVLDVEEPNYLSFTWDLNTVTFELKALENNTQTEVNFTEWLAEVTDHSPRDVTGWMVCLNVIANIFDGKEPFDREDKWHELYPSIKEMLEQQSEFEFE
ncbi:SRPBCC domain-containing protein [Fundicoccus sp. Sow4_D5]|uniref:SRPBCC domain-containing protein n=1 Tax=Fundicoccus sp. Sow4_D5 TaxID=3438782 RepID=UPI003F911B80